MLVLSRFLNERIMIGDNIIITVVRIGTEAVRVGIEAPSDMPIYREEVVIRVKNEGSLAERGKERTEEN
jgi:carbon storage regulator